MKRERIVQAEVEHAVWLSHIVRTAKAHWGYPARWMNAWREFLVIRPEHITANHYFVAQPDGAPPVGLSGVHHDGADWRLEHLWVLPAWHGHGLGKQLFERAATLVRARGGSAFLIQADPHAEGFYLRMGAVRTGQVNATMFGVPHVLPELRYAIA